MTETKENTLRKKIIEEMTVDYANALEKNFELAKQFIRITKEGKVDILLKDKLSGSEQILLYLIGKMYAKKAELSTTGDAGNKELMNELGIPRGSVLPWLKKLRDENKINMTKRGQYAYHSISGNFIEKTLKSIDLKIKKALKGD